MLFESLVVFEILVIKDLRFCPLNPLLRNIWPKLRCDQIKIVEMSITSSTTFNKIWIVQELSLKYFGPFCAPYLKGQSLLLDIRGNVLWFCTFLVQQLIRNSLLHVLEILQVSFKGRTCDSQKGPYINKIKGAYCLGHYSEKLIILFCNAFCRFRNIGGQRLEVLVP